MINTDLLFVNDFVTRNGNATIYLRPDAVN